MFLKNAMWLDCGRLLLGIGVGLFSYVVIPLFLNSFSADKTFKTKIRELLIQSCVSCRFRCI